MERRKFLQLSTVTIIILFTPIKLEAYEHLKELTFKEIYPKSIFQKSYFSWLVLLASMIVAGVVTYFTAGSGAPAAATGVSTVASWIGGGGAGSYMAGLSTVGSVVGGNAIVGAAILNGISIGTIGYGGSRASLLIAARVAETTDIVLNGIASIKDPDSPEGIYVFDIKIPKDLGSGTVRKLVDRIYDLNKEKEDAIEDKNFSRAQEIDREINKLYDKGIDLLESEVLKVYPSLENLFILGIIAYKKGRLDLFYQALLLTERLYSSSLSKRSFLDYLWGIYYASFPKKEKIKKAFDYFIKSYEAENYTIEPILAIITISASEYYNKKEVIKYFIHLAEENYDSDKYDGKNLLNLYFKAGTIAFSHKDWKEALIYFQKAYDELGWIGKILWTTKPLKKMLKFYISICYKNLGDIEKAIEYLNYTLEECDSKEEAMQYLEMFEESSSLINNYIKNKKIRLKLNSKIRLKFKLK